MRSPESWPKNVAMEHLAIDIGASSGKMLLGHLEDGRLVTELVHRFDNSLIESNGHLCWDIDMLYDEILTGIDKAPAASTVSIDTWGVDFILLDEDGQRLGDAVSYRDRRTKGIDCPVGRRELYRRTGTQHQDFNTI